MKYLILFLLVSVSFSAYSADFDLELKRDCFIEKFEHDPDNRISSSTILAGFFVRTSDSGRLSLNDLIQDKFIFFTKEHDANTDFPMPYFWRYGGDAKQIVNEAKLSVYLASSLRGPINISFENLNDVIRVTLVGTQEYNSPNGNNFLFSATCSL